MAGVVEPEGVEVPGVDEGFALVAVLVAVLVAGPEDEVAGGPDGGAEVPGGTGS